MVWGFEPVAQAFHDNKLGSDFYTDTRLQTIIADLVPDTWLHLSVSLKLVFFTSNQML